jgi:hypothetical protein
MSTGNRSVLVILDSRQVAARQTADLAVCAALDHMGVAWQVLDAGDYWALPAAYVLERAALVFAHDGAGAGLRPEPATWIRDAVLAGVGVLSFDRDTAAWPDALRGIAPDTAGGAEVRAVHFSTASHAITASHRPGETVELLAGTYAVRFVCGAGVTPVASGTGDLPVLVRTQRGGGRCVFFAVGNTLYDETVLGHTRGLDGLYWRALAWVARKPFPMRCIPPFISARMDDCNGAHTAFAYVDCLNRRGISPNLGLFLDELGPTDWAAVSRLSRHGGADISMHAFRDDLYKSSPAWKPYAVLADKPDLSKAGRETLFEGVGMDHATGRDLDEQTVRRNFARVDAAFAKAGIRPSRVLNAHFGEIGLSSLPHYLERGVNLPCNNSVIGQLYGNQPVWRPRPYGLRAANGRYGVVIDRLPQHPAFLSIGFSASHLGRTHMTSDVLSGNTPFMGEASQLRAAEAIQRGIANLRVGLDSLAFSVIMTHEQRIHSIALEDWEKIVAAILDGIRDLDAVPASREHISLICKRLFETRLSFAQADEGGLVCEITGSAEGPSPITIWEDQGDQLVSRRAEVGPVNGFLRAAL